MKQHLDLGPAPADSRGAGDEFSAEWDPEHQRVFLTEWNPFDAQYEAFIGLSVNQMNHLVDWWHTRQSGEAGA